MLRASRNSHNTIAIAVLTLITLAISSPGCNKSPDTNTADNANQTTTIETQSKPNKRTINTGAEIANDPLPQLTGTNIYEFDINGMTCAGCASTIGSALNTLPDVQNVRVSLINNKTWIRVLENSPTNENKLATTIKDAGYEPTFIQLTSNDKYNKKQPPPQNNTSDDG